MKKCCKDHKRNRTLSSRFRRKKHMPMFMRPLVLVASDPADGATGVSPDIEAIKLIFARGVKRRRFEDDCRCFRDDHRCRFPENDKVLSVTRDNCDCLFQDEVCNFHFQDGDCRCHCHDDCDSRDECDRRCKDDDDHRQPTQVIEKIDMWQGLDPVSITIKVKENGMGKKVILVKPVQRLRENTTYKVRVKYVTTDKHGCMQQSADMIVFTTGYR